MEAARKAKCPIIIQCSNGGGSFLFGKGIKSPDGAAAGAVALAMHVRSVAKYYGVPVVLPSDHCAKKLLPWFAPTLKADEEHSAKHGEPLFSSHMIDLSEEPLEENLEICAEYLERMDKIGLLLEMELGITGGEEDGVNNEDVALEDLYSKPEEIYQVYDALTPISNMFTVAAAFGNVHGVYAPGNVDLQPVILHNSQKYISEKLGDGNDKPMLFVFHGGSGSSVEDIKYAIEA